MTGCLNMGSKRPPIIELILKSQFVFAFIWLAVEQITGDCPYEETTAPCRCEEDYYLNIRLTCDGQSNGSLREVFVRIAAITQPDERQFYSLVVADLGVKKLEYDTTYMIGFKKIVIDAPNLALIHSEAFIWNSNQVKEFIIGPKTKNLESQKAPYNFFDLINSFENIELVEIHAFKSQTIPSYAFKQLPKLHSLTFSMNASGKYPLSIGEKPFFNLANIQTLAFHDYSIDHVDRSFLNFDTSTKELVLNFTGNYLAPNSFADRAFENIKRPATINMNCSQITFLKRNAFKAFLEANQKNTIDLKNMLDCSDCRNLWLVRSNPSYKQRVKNPVCSGNENSTIFDSSWSHCNAML